MKKVISIILALAMIATLSVSAMASGVITQDTTLKNADTAISFDVDPTYTVTIPSTITLEKTTAGLITTYENDLEIVAEQGVRLIENTSIVVKLESDFELTASAGTKLPYTVSVGNGPIANNGTVATFVTLPAGQVSVMHIAANNPIYAGDYSDTVTFTVSVQ